MNFLRFLAASRCRRYSPSLFQRSISFGSSSGSPALIGKVVRGRNRVWLQSRPCGPGFPLSLGMGCLPMSGSTGLLATYARGTQVEAPAQHSVAPHPRLRFVPTIKCRLGFCKGETGEWRPPVYLSDDLAGASAVRPHLRNESLGIRKALILPDEVEELHLDLIPVEVAVEVEEKDLQDRSPMVERRSRSEICSTAVALPGDEDPDGVDAVGQCGASR